MGKVGDMLKNIASSATSVGSGIASSALSAIDSSIGSSSSAHYARRNMREQDKIQRDFLLDS